MIENQSLIEQLQKLLTQKKSRKYYADRLGISENEVIALMRELRGVETEAEIMNYVSELENVVVKFDEDLKSRKAELVANVDEQIKTLDELIEKCKIDTKTWNIDRYVQNFWGSAETPKWQVKAWLSKRTEAQNFTAEFTKFLETYSPSVYYANPPKQNEDLSNACLVINNQDQHLNKFDIHGENSIESRFSSTFDNTRKIIKAASALNYVDQIYYIIGSDHFNSEWTGTTTKGTKQENILPYQESFSKICNHEIMMIDLLGSFCDDLKVLYVAGNHDEYVGWHLITWLQAYYKEEDEVEFDISWKYTKYIQYGSSAMMFNHGDAIKPAKLASIFPIAYKEKWSECENYYIFTGDKHHEISMELNGIKFYQLPALSTAKSLWDDKNGYTCDKPEITAFVIDRDKGITSILKQPM